MNFFAPKFASKKALEAKDPLLKYGQHKLTQHERNQLNEHRASSRHKTRNKMVHERFGRGIELAMLILFPFLNYVAVLCMVLCLYNAYSILVWMMFFTIVVFDIGYYLLMEIIYRDKPHEWRKWIGFFRALAAFVGVTVGLCIHYQWMVFYRSYHDLVRYDNIEAQHSALQFEDGGIIEFAKGGRLDTSRAVGFRDIRNSRTICVAPVIDGQMTEQDAISFFAVGINCCNFRSSFHCDDALKPAARGGLLKLEPGLLAPTYWEWAVDDSYDVESFEKAVDLQKSVFGAHVAENHRFLRWLEHPNERVESYRHCAWEVAIYSCIAYFAVTIPFAVRDKWKHDRRKEDITAAMTTQYNTVYDEAEGAVSAGI